jgi:hypothetical protein
VRQLKLVDLNRKLLFTQNFSKKAVGSGAVVSVTDSCCGINSQNYSQSFISYWARIDNFRDDDLRLELKPKRGLVRTWTVRWTMHIIPAKDYHTYVLGSGGVKLFKAFERLAKNFGLPAQQIRISSLYKPVLEKMKGRSVTTQEIKSLVTTRMREMGYRAGWSGIREMASLGMIVNAGRKGSMDLWMRSDEWISKAKKIPDIDTYRIELLRKYIQQFGPVSRADILYWSGLSANEVDLALNTLSSELEKVSVKGSNQEYFAMDKISNASPQPPKVILLPKFDSLMMGYKDKSRFMDMQNYKRVFGPLGMVAATVLINGFVAGKWKKRREGRKMLVDVELFREVTTADKRAMEEKFIEYGGLETEVMIRFIPA